MAYIFTRSGSSVTLPNPLQGDYHDVEDVKRTTRYTAGGRQKTINFGPAYREIRATFQDLTKTEFLALRAFLKGALDWNVHNCTITDHGGTVIADMKYQLPPSGETMDYTEKRGGPIYDVTLSFRQDST